MGLHRTSIEGKSKTRKSITPYYQKYNTELSCVHVLTDVVISVSVMSSSGLVVLPQY